MQIINLYLKNRSASEHARAQRLVCVYIYIYIIKPYHKPSINMMQ